MSLKVSREHSTLFLLLGILVLRLSLTGCGGGSMTPEPHGDGPSVPVIIDFNPKYGNIGSEVILVVKNAGKTAKENAVFFSGIKSPSVDLLEGEKIAAIVPEGAPAGLARLWVEVDGKKSNEVLFDVVGSRSYPVGNNPSSVAIGDLDGDGNLDFVVANGGSSSVSVLLNRGDGAFQAAIHYSAGREPSSVACGDLDENGNLDLAVANSYSDDVTILLIH